MKWDDVHQAGKGILANMGPFFATLADEQYLKPQAPDFGVLRNVVWAEEQRSPMPSSAQTFLHRPYDAYGFLLVLSDRKLAVPPGSELDTAWLPFMDGMARELVRLAPSLASLATAVIVNGSGTPSPAVLHACAVAAQRLVPIIWLGSEQVPWYLCSPRVAVFRTMGQRVLRYLADVKPSGKFPFYYEPGGQEGAEIKPLAPLEFVCLMYPPESQAFSVVIARMSFMVSRAHQNGLLKPKTRYYAEFIGDQCTGIADESGTRLISLLSQHRPETRGMKPLLSPHH